MTQARDGSLATGLYWHDGSPVLALADGTGTEEEHPVAVGASFSWRLCGPRHCTGIWLAGEARRQPCPRRAVISERGTRAQCPACATADPGRALARDAAPEDLRTFAAYLAWFGPGLLKIGITAAERGNDRLAEQAALAYSWLAQGPLHTMRRLEQAAAATGTVTERMRRQAKIAAWWTPGPESLRTGQLTAAHRGLRAALDLAALAQRLPCEVRDLAETFGLGSAPPRPSGEITGVADGAVVSGVLLCLAGRDAILATPGGPLLINFRLLSGWTLSATTETARGLALAPAAYAGGDNTRSSYDPAQGTLF